MADLAKYVVRLEAETAKFRKGLDRANRNFERFHKDTTRRNQAIIRGFARLAGPAAMGAVIIKAAKMADQFNQLSVRIRTATRDTGDFAKVQRTLVGIAVDTGAALETTVDVFQAFSRVREDIGATNDQVLTLTRTLNQLGVIGGTSTQAMANGLRQFSQAITGNVFKAEEFNSLLENTPEIVNAIAKGLGRSQGEIVKMAKSGRLFVNETLNALLRQAPEIAGQFAEIPSNLDRAFNALTTSIGAALSKIDQATGTTRSFAENIEVLADALAVAFEVATPEQQLQDQFRVLLKEYNLLTRVVAETNGRNSQAVQRLKDLALQLAGTSDALAFFRGEMEQVSELSKDVAVDMDKLDAALDKAFKDNRQLFKGARILPDVLGGIVSPDKVDTESQFVGFDLGRSKDNFAAIEDEADKFAERMKAISRQASSNMADAWSDFFFDPFDDNLKGLLRSFVDTIRRMAANQATVGLFRGLGGLKDSDNTLLSSLGTFFAGSFQTGGMVPGPPGSARLALVHGGEQIIPAGQGGGVVVQQNLTFNGGADPAQLAQFGEFIRSQTRADIADLFRRRQL